MESDHIAAVVGADGRRVRPATFAEYAAVNGLDVSSVRLRRRQVVPRNWKRRVADLHGWRCVVTGCAADQAHHVVPVRILIQEGLEAFAGDPRNGVPVARLVHELHEHRLVRIPRAALPARVFEFVAELNLAWYLERHYPDVNLGWKYPYGS